MNMIYKKLRNMKKKLDKIKETEDKVKKGEIVPNQEQKDMISRKNPLLEEMKQQQEIIKMYQEAFPENPAFAASGKKKKPAQQEETKGAQPTEAQSTAEPAIDIGKIVEDALTVAADAVILATLSSKFDQHLTGANQNIVDSL